MTDDAIPGLGAEARRERTTLWAGAGGILAAFLGSLCCMGPLLFVTLGVGAGLASTFAPLRPLFGVLMLGSFAVAFYAVYGRRRRALPTGSAAAACAAPRARRRERVILWLAALLALVLWTFPTWSLRLA
ncbi:MAG: hypothetical protein LOY01_01670 [Brachybacterium paraconglomeratum]|nr:hypothetical protein [Brachybacterium paraconglomeratum]